MNVLVYVVRPDSDNPPVRIAYEGADELAVDHGTLLVRRGAETLAAYAPGYWYTAKRSDATTEAV